MTSNYGIKIMKPGKDIISDIPEDHIFSSKYGSVKVYAEPPDKQYLTAVVPAGGTLQLTIPHGLPFVPMVMWFAELSPGSGGWYTGAVTARSPTDFAAGSPYVPLGDPNTYVDATNIKVKYRNDTASNKTIKYYYFIFADNGE